MNEFIQVSIFSSLVIFFLVQVYYYIFYFIRLARYKIPTTENLSTQTPVSIIICAFNEFANLQKNLHLILDQDYYNNGKKNFEVVVVNDNSTDESDYFLNDLKQRFSNLSVIHLTQESLQIKGKKFPLSMGIKSAHFEHLLLTDADCVPSSNQWLKITANHFSNTKKIVLGFSPFIKQKGFLNKTIRFETCYSALQYFSFALAKNPYMGVGRNLAYVKELFNKNKGFSAHHHILSGDDDLFINAIATKENTAVCIHPDAFVYSEAKNNIAKWNLQKKRHLSTGKYYKTKHKISLGLSAFSHFFFWAFFITALFTKFWFIACAIFVFRWLFLWLIMNKVLKLFKEEDLLNLVWFFDFWYLWYHLKNIPNIFFKTSNRWK
ncbi:MAG: glycosyltransferase [Chitinophagaceae bacterium]|nr:glycosyltransferase [Chitinophagaceae bacterium]